MWSAKIRLNSGTWRRLKSIHGSLRGPPRVVTDLVVAEGGVGRQAAVARTARARPGSRRPRRGARRAGAGTGSAPDRRRRCCESSRPQRPSTRSPATRTSSRAVGRHLVDHVVQRRVVLGVGGVRDLSRALVDELLAPVGGEVGDVLVEEVGGGDEPVGPGQLGGRRHGRPVARPALGGRSHGRCRAVARTRGGAGLDRRRGNVSAGRSESGPALADGAGGVTVEQPSAPRQQHRQHGPHRSLSHPPHRRRQGLRTRAATPPCRARSPHSRWSMSRKPVFLARTPRLVSQVSAQRTTPTASSTAGDLVLHHVGLEPRPRTAGGAAADRTDHGQDRRCTEGVLGRRAAAQDQAARC